MTNFIARISGAIVHQREWCHRKVVQFQFLDGNRTSIRHSLDCTIPTDLCPTTQELAELGFTNPGAVDLSIVPLGTFPKGPLRHFNLEIPGESSPNVLLHHETTPILVEVALYLLSRTGVTSSDSLREELTKVIEYDVEDATITAKKIISSLSVNGPISAQTAISPIAENFILDLVENFWVMAYIPSTFSGKRSIIKWSHQAHLAPTSRGKKVAQIPERIGAAFGIVPLRVQLPMRGSSQPRSFHLEVIAPSNIQCTGLALPEPSEAWRGHEDRILASVAHAHGTYIAEPRDNAILGLQLESRPRLHQFIGAFGAVVLSSVALFYPGALEHINRNPDPSVGLLLFVPAFIAAGVVLAPENLTVSLLTNPLRISSAVISGLLLAAATTVVVGASLNEQRAVLFVTLAIGALVSIASLMGFVRSHQRKSQ